MMRNLWLALMTLLATCGFNPAYAHNEDPEGCMKYLVPIVNVVGEWAPSKAGVKDGRYYTEAYGFPDKPILEVFYRLMPEEYWHREGGKVIPTFFIPPSTYWLDVDSDGLQERYFVDYGRKMDCMDMGHYQWNPIIMGYEMVNRHSEGGAPHNGGPRGTTLEGLWLPGSRLSELRVTARYRFYRPLWEDHAPVPSGSLPSPQQP